MLNRSRMFEQDLKNNLYQDLESHVVGQYFPPPVRHGGDTEERRRREALGHSDGGRPDCANGGQDCTWSRWWNRPSIQTPMAIGLASPRSMPWEAARQRCWRYAWVIDLDIRGFFDNLDHELVLRAVRKYTQCPWILLYIEAVARSPRPTGGRHAGAADEGDAAGRSGRALWWPIFFCTSRSTTGCAGFIRDVPFERYADDIVAHCGTETQAQQVLESIRRRLAQCRLEVHPGKTHIVYCKDDDRPRGYPAGTVRLPGIHVSPSAVEESMGQVLHQLHAGGELDGGDQDAPGDAALAAASAERQGHRRPGAHVESGPPGLDPVLRALLSSPRCTRSSAISMTFWSAGPCGNTNASAGIVAGPHIGSAVSLGREPRLFAHWHLLGLRPAAG